MNSAAFLLCPVPMTFNLKSFQISLEFKDGDEKMILALSEQKEDSNDVFKVEFRDPNNFAIFRGSKTSGCEDINTSDNMECSASGTFIRDEDLVSFALMWLFKLITDEDLKIFNVVLNNDGRMRPVFGRLIDHPEPQTESSNPEKEDNENSEFEFSIEDISSPLDNIMSNFADLLDHFLN